MNNEAAEIARQLSADERDALQDSGWNSRIYIDERDTTITVYDKLFLKGLLQRTIFDVQGERDVYYTILPLGRDVLAALQPASEPAQAGGATGDLTAWRKSWEEWAKVGLPSRVRPTDNTVADLETALASAESRLRQAEAAFLPIVETWKEWKGIEWFREVFDNTDFTAEMFDRAAAVLATAKPEEG